MTTIKLKDGEYELKFSFKAHKELQKIIKAFGEGALEFLTNAENIPTIIQISLRASKPDATIEEIEDALDNLTQYEITQLMQPYTKYYADPNAQSPKS